MRHQIVKGKTELVPNLLPRPNHFRPLAHIAGTLLYLFALLLLVVAGMQTLAIALTPRAELDEVLRIFPHLAAESDWSAKLKIAVLGLAAYGIPASAIIALGGMLQGLYGRKYVPARQPAKLGVGCVSLLFGFCFCWMALAGVQLLLIGPASSAPPQFGFLNPYINEDRWSMLLAGGSCTGLMCVVFAIILVPLWLWRRLDRGAQMEKIAELRVWLKNHPRSADSAALREMVLGLCREFKPDAKRQLLQVLHEFQRCGQASQLLHDANLTRVDLSRLALPRMGFDGVNLSRALLMKAELPHANFSNAQLTRVNASRANLAGARFANAQCRHADFRGADVRNADFFDADLSHADLRGTGVTFRQLHEALNLHGVQADPGAWVQPHTAFISHHRQTDGDVALRLKKDLEPLLAQHASAGRVFVDRQGIRGGEPVVERLQQAASQADFFILLARPESAASAFVQQEVQWWMESNHAGPENLLIVLTDGELVWDEAAHDWAYAGASTPLNPNVFRGYFPRMPNFLELTPHVVASSAYRDVLRRLGASLLRTDPDLVRMP